MFCNKHGIVSHHFPIKDRSLPDNGFQTEQFIQNIFNEIMAGRNAVIHCRMGIGRSSIIAGAILLHAGFVTGDIIKKIITARGVNVPDTDDQLKWLRLRDKKRTSL